MNNRDLYIDSEFAYALPLQEVENENKIIRFDLVRLKEGVLSFVELKLISDPRLRGKNIDIIKQMKKYSDYINDNKDLFVYYYLKVAKIKYKIGILKEEPSIIRISKKPILLLVNNYSELTDGRIDRIKDIESILRNEKIDYTILDYSKCE
ncbi:hypothetical protein LJC28_00895 [Dysgonomonas sp. OttesenSCG-928-D17]|nr:hypothetical protein [Dysgonomonas sp. OttesenSCG-928-D17]